MSAVAVPVSASTRSPRGLRGLPWTVLRLHRTALTVWTAFVLGSVGYLVWLTEVTADSVHASAAWYAYADPMGWISTFMYYGFWVVAAWAAGALIGRELESGTARLAWTQSVTPARWLTAKLALPALAIVLGGAVFVPVFRWAWSAHRDLMGDNLLFNDVFADHGPLVVAYGLCALAVGTLTALLVRRTLPAQAVSVLVLVVLNRYLERRRLALEPTHGFWTTHLAETGIVLTITALATTTAFRVLHHQTT